MQEIFTIKKNIKRFNKYIIAGLAQVKKFCSLRKSYIYLQQGKYYPVNRKGYKMKKKKEIDPQEVYKKYHIRISDTKKNQTFEDIAQSFTWPVMFFPSLKIKDAITCSSDNKLRK